MTVRIRMKKFGRKHRPFFRIVAVDVRSPRDGRVLEELGAYDPLVPETEARVTLTNDRILYWLSVGAQPSDKVAVMIKKYVEFPQAQKIDPKAKKFDHKGNPVEGNDADVSEPTKNPYTIHNLVEKFGQAAKAKAKQAEAQARVAEARRPAVGFSASLVKQTAAPVATAEVLSDAADAE